MPPWRTNKPARLLHSVQSHPPPRPALPNTTTDGARRVGAAARSAVRLPTQRFRNGQAETLEPVPCQGFSEYLENRAGAARRRREANATELRKTRVSWSVGRGKTGYRWLKKSLALLCDTITSVLEAHDRSPRSAETSWPAETSQQRVRQCSCAFFWRTKSTKAERETGMYLHTCNEIHNERPKANERLCNTGL